MTNQEAIKRIKEHIAIHKYRESHAIHIVEALEMAISALQEQEAKYPTGSSLTQKELDSISRKAAIDAICKEGTRLERNGTVAMCEIKQWCVDLLEQLPSAQPEDCDTCKHGYFGDGKCDNCRVRFPSHYERRTDETD